MTSKEIMKNLETFLICFDVEEIHIRKAHDPDEQWDKREGFNWCYRLDLLGDKLKESGELKIEKCCGNCNFWYLFPFKFRPVGVIKYSGIGRCRRYPPSHYKSIDMKEYPKMQANEAPCGEWQPICFPVPGKENITTVTGEFGPKIDGCGNCEYWKCAPIDMIRPGAKEKSQIPWGQCRAHPPEYLKNGLAEWPIVSLGDKCGEYREKWEWPNTDLNGIEL